MIPPEGLGVFAMLDIVLPELDEAVDRRFGRVCFLTRDHVYFY